MARPIFWPSNDSYVLSVGGAPNAGIPVKIYTQQTGGTQVTDLVAVAANGTTGAAIPNGVLISDSNGLIPAFGGPDGGPTTLWGNHGMSGERVALTADPTGAGGGGGGGAVSSVVGQTGVITASQIASSQPGTDQWIKDVAGGFGFAFVSASATDAATGLPTTAVIRWPDGTGGSFTGTIDSGGNGYSGFTATWAGSTTRTLTATGITYDANGTAFGPTGLAVA